MIDTAWSRPGPGLQNAPSFVSAAYLVAELHILGYSNETCTKPRQDLAPDIFVEGKFYKSRSRQAAETSDGALQSPCPGLDSAVSIVSPARRTGEQRPTEIRRDGTQPTGGAYVLPIPVHQGCRDQRWRLSKPVPWARQRGVYRLSSPADRRAASEDLSQIPPPAHLLRALPGRGARDTDPMRWVASPAAAQGRRNGWKQAIKPAEGLTARGALRRVRKSE